MITVFPTVIKAWEMVVDVIMLASTESREDSRLGFRSKEPLVNYEPCSSTGNSAKSA